MDMDPALRSTQHPRQLLAQRERVLGGGPDLDLLAAHIRDRDERLQMEVIHPGEGEGVLEDVVAVVPDGVRAGLVPELVTDVGPRPELTGGACSVRRDDAGRCLFEQLRGVGCESGLDVGDGRQRLVRHLDQLQRVQRHRLGLGGDGRHHIARVPHPVQGDDRLVLDEVAVGGVESVELVAGQHGVHAR